MSTPTQAPYEIAKYLPEHARRAAAAREYTPRLGFHAGLRRDSIGRCPLGASLDYMGLIGSGAPPASEVAEVLDLGIEQGAVIMNAATAFIRDWETGRITDLAAALGVA